MKDIDSHTKGSGKHEADDRLRSLSRGAAILAGLYVTGLTRHPLFHDGLAGLSGIVVAFGIFAIAWKSRAFLNNNYLLCIGIASLFIGGTDLMHFLARAGMGFPFSAGASGLASPADRLFTAISFYALYLAVIKTGAGGLFGIMSRSAKRRERKRTDEALKKSEARYMALCENAPDMYASVSPKTALVEDCNRTLANALGYSKAEIIGQPVFGLYHPDCLEEVKKTFRLFTEQGEIHDKEFQLRRKDGSKLDVSLSVSSVRDKDGDILYGRLTLRDITERKRNDAIHASCLHLMQFAVTHSLDALLEETLNEAEKLSDSRIGFYHFVEEDQKFLTLQNWSARTKAEFCRAEGKGLHYAIAEAGVWVDCVHQRKPVIHNDYASLPHRKGMPEGHAEVIRELVVPVLRGDKIKAILGVGNKPSDYGEKDAQTISLLADLAWEIAERKKVDDALRRLNRELRAISSCSQSLLRATDEQALLNNICRIISDEAGYRMAWVGYAGKDEAKTVRPVACAGVEERYLENSGITAADSERGRGPTGTAIRSGESAWIQDFTTDPRAAPWREAALQRGYRSSIALPLKDESANTFGALNIYSVEPNAFTTDEIRLLEELADDLAFGITVLRARAGRKRAEQNLALLNLALNNVHDEAFLINEQARFEYVNDEASRALGCSREELLGMGETDVDPDLPPDRWAGHWRELKERGALTYEGRHKTRDGRVYPVEIRANYFEYNGREYNLALVRDITERRRILEAMRVSEQRQLLHVMQTPLGVIEWNLGFEVTKWNPAAERIFGFSRSEALGAHASFIVPQSAKDSVDQVWSDLIHQKGGLRSTNENITKDGRLIYCEWYNTPLVDAGGSVIAVVSMILDVTERRRAEDALRESEARLKEAQRLAHLGHWELDLRKNALFWSDEVYRIFGLEPQEFGATYEAFLDRVHPDDRDFVNRAYTESVQNRTGYDIEHRVLLETNEIKFVNERCNTEYDDTGTPVRSIGTVLDVTDRKLAENEIRRLNTELEQRVVRRTEALGRKSMELEGSQRALMNIVEDLNLKTDELEQANVKLKELDRLKSMFIASMSHELRTPLNSIIGFSSITLEEWTGPLNDEQKKNLGTVLRSGRHLLSLINDVIDVSKIEAGKHEVAVEDFDLYGLVMDTVSMFRKEIEEKGLALHVEPAHLDMHTDRRRLLQCLVNLLSNAVKFTERGRIEMNSNVVLTGKTLPEPVIVEIVVSDTGIGMEQKDLPKLFSAFTRIPSSLSAKVKGTGLGLYLVKKITTEILKGEVTVQSAPGEGSSFCLRIPSRL